MQDKILSCESAIKLIKSGSTVMIGGFLTCGNPKILMDCLAASGARDLTTISNDAGYPGEGVGALFRAGVVKKAFLSHMGPNPEAAKLMNAGKMEIELIPQGTLAERIRIGGAGLGGFLTPTGVGTEVEKGKQKITIDGKEYLLELPLRADVALIRGSVVDRAGNVYYRGTTKNHNPNMATAADLVIVAAEEIVEVGQIPPEHVMTPSIYVDYIVGGEPRDGRN